MQSNSLRRLPGCTYFYLKGRTAARPGVHSGRKKREVEDMNSFLRVLRMPVTLLALVALTTLPAVYAHHPDLQTSFTVDERTMVPGATLDPKTTYMLKVLKSDTDRHVVQIFNENGSRMLTTFLGVSDSTPTVKDGLSFMEMQGDHAKVVSEWSHPEWGGLKFVYSESEARDIRQHSNESVLWTRNRVTANTSNLEGIQVASMGQETAGGSREQVARNEGAGLPRTASELPLLGMIGVALLSAALALRFAISSKS
jgi:hypothetical protein